LNWKILTIITTFLSFLPFVIGLIKHKKIHNKYKPFILLLALYSTTEISGTFLIILNLGVYLTFLMNIFVLFDFIFLFVILSTWTKNKIAKTDYLIIFLFSLLWIWDNFFFSNLTVTNSIFRIGYSLMICIKSISLINKQLMRIDKNFIKNPFFIIGATLLLFFTYKSIYETIYFINLNLNKEISYWSFYVLVFVNILSYILFIIAILCMEKKTKLSSTY
jgi:hypothetical protein